MKALALWKNFAEWTYRLDAQAIDALRLRDELQTAALDDDDIKELLEIDARVLQEAERIVRDLERTGAMVSVRWYRDENASRRAFWWWLDHLVEAKLTPARPPTAVSRADRLDEHPRQRGQRELGVLRRNLETASAHDLAPAGSAA